MDFELIDYPIATPDGYGDLVMKVLPITSWVVIKEAPLIVRLARDMLEQAPAGMVEFVDDGSTLGLIKVVARNGHAVYRVDDWNPSTWHYVCVRLEHMDSDRVVRKAPRLERREVGLSLNVGQG